VGRHNYLKLLILISRFRFVDRSWIV
jgi:hypothetical protein